MKKSELKKQLEQQIKINNIAVGENYNLNKTINELEAELEFIKQCLDESEESKKKFLNKNIGMQKALNIMGKNYEKHMEIAEKEIARLNVIIDYLETRDLK